MPNNKFSQISLFDIYEDVNTSFTEKKSELVSLLEKHIDFSSFISYDFHHAFYSSFGRKHKYHLESYIKALIIQKLFAFSYDSQLILVLKFSDELRNFCGFDKVPDGSYFTRPFAALLLSGHPPTPHCELTAGCFVPSLPPPAGGESLSGR